MHLLLGDETNKPPEKGQFFIYGGLVIPTTSVVEVHTRLQAIRRKHGIQKHEGLKFTNEKGRAADRHRQIKADVLKMLIESGTKFIAISVLQQILGKQSEERYMEFAVNTMTQTYHRYLVSEDAYGAFLIDRVQSAKVNKVLRDMSSSFQLGLKFPENYNHPVNDRIVVFGMTNNNASHLSSCADITLGAFRYCVNAATGHSGAKEEVAKELMPLVDKLFWREKQVKPLSEPSGFQLRPLAVSSVYQEKYEELKSSLKRFGMQTNSISH